MPKIDPLIGDGFKKWLQSEHGKKCSDPYFLRYPANDAQYLHNRLYWAFYAGFENTEEWARYTKIMTAERDKNALLTRENNSLKRKVKKILNQKDA